MHFTKLIFIAFILYSSSAVSTVEEFFSEAKSEPQRLYTFLKEMPKGGELHYHLAGGAYPEIMLKIAAKTDYCLDTDYKLVKQHPCLQKLTVADTKKKSPLYKKIINAWSMENFVPNIESGHDHFFASFYKFFPIVVDHQALLLADIMKRAAKQHELYMEIMVMPDNAKSASFIEPSESSLAAKMKTLLANKKFQKNIHDTITTTTDLLHQARQLLNCDRDPQQQTCLLTVKFQYYVLREQPLDNIFAQALNGFVAASLSDDIIAINLVQAEDGYLSMRDYQQQMNIFRFLHQAYPNVNIALHAGELDISSLTKPISHIHDALFIAKAKRIGHGSAINAEQHKTKIMQHMRQHQIAVEINLTSNYHILGISGLHGKKHPLPIYLKHQVPVVLSTDDEGILRTNLTNEFVRAVTDFNLDYKTIKMINRNTLIHNFLPGKSLWIDVAHNTTVSECRNLDSWSCHQFIAANKKANVEWRLEKKLLAFEAQFMRSKTLKNRIMQHGNLSTTIDR
ncbi:MAG: adenosine deaminase family protein [Legionella sp.]